MASDEEPASPYGGAIIKVVGPCKAGKSTLVAGLTAAGYAARSCCQEHSEAPAMWQRIHPPDCLIFLDVALESIQARVQRSDWSAALLATQHRRLAHARHHADLIVATDQVSSQEVLRQVLDFLKQSGFPPHSGFSSLRRDG